MSGNRVACAGSRWLRRQNKDHGFRVQQKRRRKETKRRRRKGNTILPFVSPLVNHEYWMAVEEGVQQGAKENGVNVNVLGDTKVDGCDGEIYRHCDCLQGGRIVTMALSPAALSGRLSTGRRTRESLWSWWIRMLPDSKREAYVGTSNYDVGYEAGNGHDKCYRRQSQDWYYPGHRRPGDR